MGFHIPTEVVVIVWIGHCGHRVAHGRLRQVVPQSRPQRSAGRLRIRGTAHHQGPRHASFPWWRTTANFRLS